MIYVIFREDTKTHTEVYFRRVLTGGKIDSTDYPDVARSFPSAAAAYETAGKYGVLLQYWKVRKL